MYRLKKTLFVAANYNSYDNNLQSRILFFYPRLGRSNNLIYDKKWSQNNKVLK